MMGAGAPGSTLHAVGAESISVQNLGQVKSKQVVQKYLFKHFKMSENGVKSRYNFLQIKFSDSLSLAPNLT